MGAGLAAVAGAAARLLDASVALIDRSSAVLAVAGASPDQEERLIARGGGAALVALWGRAPPRDREERRLAGGEGVTVVALRVADTAVGELRYRAKSPPAPSIARMVTTLLGLLVEGAPGPRWARDGESTR